MTFFSHAVHVGRLQFSLKRTWVSNSRPGSLISFCTARKNKITCVDLMVLAKIPPLQILVPLRNIDIMHPFVLLFLSDPPFKTNEYWNCKKFWQAFDFKTSYSSICCVHPWHGAYWSVHTCVTFTNKALKTSLSLTIQCWRLIKPGAREKRWFLEVRVAPDASHVSIDVIICFFGAFAKETTRRGGPRDQSPFDAPDLEQLRRDHFNPPK